MPNDDQLTAEDLTALMQVRANLGADDPRAAKLDKFITSQLKNYIPDTSGQAKQSLQNIPQYTSKTDELRARLANAQAGIGPEGERYNQYQKESGTFAGTVAGTMATGGLLPAVKGGGALVNAARLAGRSGLAGVGAGTGALAAGATPQEAGITAAGATIGQPIAEGATALSSTIAKNLPSSLRASAGGTLGSLKAGVGNVPVNTSEFGDTALELWTQSQRGSTLPAAVRKLVNRITNPGSEPITYAETKDFQSNISNLLKNPVGEEGAALKNPNTYRLVTELNQKLKASLEEASQLGGAAPGTFTGAMKQYSDASARQAMIDRIHDLAVKGIKIGAGGVIGGSAAGLGYDVYKLIKGDTGGKK